MGRAGKACNGRLCRHCWLACWCGKHNSIEREGGTCGTGSMFAESCPCGHGYLIGLDNIEASKRAHGCSRT